MILNYRFINVANESRLFRNKAIGRDDGESLRIMKDGRRRSMIANIFARAHNQYFLSRIFAVKYEGASRGKKERKGGRIYT